MKIILINLLLLFGLSAISQTLNIDQCQQKARNNYPLIKQHNLLELCKAYDVSNISKTYLPQISLNGQATYQSDVTHVPINIAGMNLPNVSKDQYKMTIDINQTLWDGSAARSQKKVINAKNEVEKQNIEVNLYEIKDRVSQLFFGITMLNKQIIQQGILRENLQTNYNISLAKLNNGTIMQSDLDAIEIELLSNDQKKTELQTLRGAYIEMLSLLIDEPLSENIILETSNIIDSPNSRTINRPELNLLTNQYKMLDAQLNIITAKNMPRLSLFAQGGYGRPGLNMLTNKFDFWGIGGIRFSCNFGNLYTLKNDRKLISANKKIIEIQEETFLLNIRIQQTQARNEIIKVKKLIEKDDEIIALRTRIKIASESKYVNGVYNVNDLIRDINAENISKLAKIVHEIQYQQYIYNYNTISGN